MKQFLLLALLAGSVSTHAENAALSIAAASSTRIALEEIGQLFEKETGLSIRFNFDGSGLLAGQIEKGAPVDIYISAHHAFMDSLAAQNLIDAATRQTLARNRLVVAQPAPHDVFIEAPADLLRVDKVAIGNPDFSAAGKYAQQFLESQNLWSPLQARLVHADSAQATLTLVEHDEVGAALVFATDARSVTSEPGIRTSFAVDESKHAPILIEIATIRNAAHLTAAKRFYWLLETPEAKAIWKKHGFTER